MAQEQLREQNKRLVAEKALDCFLEQGIGNTRVSQIAREAGVTERSVFRYYSSKAELVQAAAYLYWDRVLARINRRLAADGQERSGLEELGQLLIYYSRLYHEDPGGLRFTLDAELTLNTAGRELSLRNRPPEPYESSNGPVARAIRKGLADGSISPEVDVKELYYNSYDSILGIMQRLSIGGTPSAVDLDYDRRMQHLSEMFVRAFRGDG